MQNLHDDHIKDDSGCLAVGCLGLVILIFAVYGVLMIIEKMG